MNIPRKYRKTLAKRVLCISAFGLICSFMGSGYANASPDQMNNKVTEQQQAKVTIQGKIADSKGEPLIGVSIVAQGTTVGTFSDIDGNYTISAAPNTTLIYSYVGFNTQKIVIGDKKTIDVTMKEDSQLMDEVVVVGYGVQKKENLTGAVVSVDVGKTLDSRPIADVGRGLQGSVPGLNITIPSGEVGSDPIMKIRGQVGSIQGNSNPLILVDNVEVPSIQMINANDIESISVLKDAASTSIYGAKGAFGVILITTKKGAKEESISVEYSNNFSWQKVAKNINMGMIDAVEYSVSAAERLGNTKTGAFWLADRNSYEKSKEWLQKYGGSVGANDPMLYGRDWYMDGSSKMGVRLYNAYDYMIEEWTPSQSHNLSVNGKSGSTTYNIGLGYFTQEGVMKPAKTDDFTRYNATVRVSSKVNKYVTVRGGMLYSDRTKRYPYATNSTTADAWYYVYRWGPLAPFGTENGNVLRSPASELANANTAEQKYSYTNVNIGATVNFTKDWTLDADYTYANQDYVWLRPGTRFTAANTWAGAIARNDANGTRLYVNDEGMVVPSTTPGAMEAYQLLYTTYTAKGSNPDHIYRESQAYKQSTANVYTTYNLKLADIHSFKFMAGLNWVKSRTNSSWSQKTELFDITNPQFSLATGTQTSGGVALWEAQLGYFGRVNYMFSDKYLFEANLRYDGSSKFPDHLKWRWFPSFSAGWIVTNESFMQSLDPVVSFAKLRASWGSIGDQSVPNYLYEPLMNSFTTSAFPAYQWINGTSKVSGYSTPLAADPNITWQDIENLNLGIDMRFFNNRLGVTYDWFQRTTKSMITQGIDLPYTFGGPIPEGNYGELRTRGWEIAVDFSHRFSNGLGINLMATLSDASSIITDFPDEATKNVVNPDALYKGKRWGDIYGYRTERLFQESDFDVTTVNGKKVYTLKAGIPSQSYFETADFKFGPGDVKFVNLNDDDEINPGKGIVGDSGDLEVIGNSTPRYEYGFRVGADYKGFDFSMFFQGVGQRKIWGNGVLAIPGFNSADGATPQTFAGDFWREDRTDAFYPRPYNMSAVKETGNMQVQSRYLLNMAYMRIKNITLGYTLPAALIQKAYLRNARVYVSAENFFTFDKLRGLPIDPEVVSGYSMFNSTNYNSGRTGVGAPMFKSLSFGIQLTF